MSYTLTKKQFDLAKIAAHEATPKAEATNAAFALAKDIAKNAKENDVPTEAEELAEEDVDLIDLVNKVVVRFRNDPEFAMRLLLKLGPLA